MKKLHILTIGILVLSLASGSLFGCSSANTSKLKVVTSTAMIAQIVDAEYKIRMKSLKSSRFNRKSFIFLEILNKKMEELNTVL